MSEKPRSSTGLYQSAAIILALGAAQLAIPAASEALTFPLREFGRTPAGGGSSVVSGDFNGDGVVDLAAYSPDGSVWVGTNSSQGLSWSRKSTLYPSAGWTIIAGNFVGDAKTDLVAYHGSNGNVWMGTNQGGTFSWARWSTVYPSAGWILLAGDFTSDGRTDLVGFHHSTGNLWVGVNRGTSFGWTLWSRLYAERDTWRLTAADFSGDGKIDVAAYNPSTRILWIGVNAGSAVTWRRNVTIDAFLVDQFISGDFNRDGRQDLAALSTRVPSLPPALWLGSNGSQLFQFSQVALLNPDSSWSWTPGDFNRDGRLDLLGVSANTGTLILAQNTN